MSSAKVARVIRRLAIWFMHLALSDTFPIGTMLRIHLPQNWFSLSDPAMEEALYEIT